MAFEIYYLLKLILLSFKELVTPTALIVRKLLFAQRLTDKQWHG